MSGMFGQKKETPRQIGKEVKRETNSAKRDIDREVKALDRDEKKIISEIKKAAKDGNERTVKIYAKQLVQLRAQREKMIGVKATVGAMGMQASTMVASATAMQAVGNTAKAMSSINQSLGSAEALANMQEFQRQMEVMNVREEMLDESLADVFDGDEVEEEADGIVDQTLAEIGIDLGAQMGHAPVGAPMGAAVGTNANAAAAEPTLSEQGAELEAQLARLQAL